MGVTQFLVVVMGVTQFLVEPRSHKVQAGKVTTYWTRVCKEKELPPTSTPTSYANCIERLNKTERHVALQDTKTLLQRVDDSDL